MPNWATATALDIIKEQKINFKEESTATTSDS